MVTLIGEATALTWPGGPRAGELQLAVTVPDGAVASPPVTVAADADPTASFTPATPGRHLLAWQGPAGERYVDVLDAWPAEPRYIISIEDALDAVRSSRKSAQDVARESMPVYVAAATWVVENITGPVLPATHTVRASGGRSIVLPHPVTEVSSMAVDGASVTVDEADVDGEAGIIYTRTRSGFRNVVVQYTTGSNLIAENVRLATREEVRFLWQVGHQGARPVGESADVTPYQAEGFAVPRRVVELLQATPRFGGFA